MNKITTDECRNDADHGVRLTVPDLHMDTGDKDGVYHVYPEVEIFWICEDARPWIVQNGRAWRKKDPAQ